jgi:hypothetical protein
MPQIRSLNSTKTQKDRMPPTVPRKALLKCQGGTLSDSPPENSTLACLLQALLLKDNVRLAISD